MRRIRCRIPPIVSPGGGPLLFGLLVFAVAPSCANFHAVEEGRVYRSAQPSEPELTRWIWKHGVETVLFLRGGGPTDPDYQMTYRPAAAAGIDFFDCPMTANDYPERDTLVSLCDIFARARYPLLLHCKGGADRSGLASAIYLLQRTGDLASAREQLDIAYLHLSWTKTGVLDHVLDMYEPWQHRMTFCQWARHVYQRPVDGAPDAGYIERQRRRAAQQSQ